jgi:hypothetical protein
MILAALALFASVAVGAPVSPFGGGTGKANPNTSIVTVAGPLTTVGNFLTTLTITAPTSITLPTSGTLATTAQITGGTLAGSFTTVTATGAVTSTASGNAFISNSTADQTGFVLQNAGVTKWTLYNRSGFADNFQILSATTGTGFTVLQASGRGSFGSGADVVGSLTATSFNDDAGNLIISSTNPTIASGFGTGPAILANNTAAFRVTVGTTPGSQGAFTMPAAPNGWVCSCQNLNGTPHMTRQDSSTTTSVSFTNYTSLAAGNFTAGSVLLFQCAAF